VTKHGLVRDRVLELIREDPTHGRPLPSERDLATAYGVSRMTARQVVEELVDQGYVYRVRGLGTFVNRSVVSKSLALTSFSEDMWARGMRPDSRVLLVERRAAGAGAGQDLGISPTEDIIRIHRVRTADEEPMCLEKIELPAALVTGLESESLTGSLYDLLASRYGIQITHADQRIRATVLEVEEAELLQAPPVSPALLVERLSHDRAGRPVERARSLYRGDRYDFRVAVDRSRSE
jgi:GntR family transcriptional regulator